MKKLSVLIILILLFSSLCFAGNKKQPTPKNLYYDIENMKVDLSTSAIKHLYNPEPFEQLQEEVMAGKLNSSQCFYRIKKLLSDYHVVHLSVYRITNIEDNPLICPISLACFGNDYYVWIADLKYSKYLGWKFKGIGDYSIDEVIDIISQYNSYETPTGKKYFIENTFYAEDYEYFGLMEKGKIPFVLESPEGKVEKVACKPIPAKKMKSRNIGTVPSEPFCCSHSTLKNYYMRAVPENRTIYIPFNKVVETYEYTVNDLFKDITTELKKGTYDTVVFDVRFNPGGNMILMDNALYQNREELKKCNLAIVTSGRTFSAACEFINYFLTVFPETKIFGEETGEAIFNYTDVRPWNKLKYLNCVFNCPIMIDDLPTLTARATDIYRGTMPDVEVAETYEGYIKGEDSVYKAIYEYFN